jgi:dihydroxyacetone kinase
MQRGTTEHDATSATRTLDASFCRGTCWVGVVDHGQAGVFTFTIDVQAVVFAFSDDVQAALITFSDDVHAAVVLVVRGGSVGHSVLIAVFRFLSVLSSHS